MSGCSTAPTCCWQYTLDTMLAVFVIGHLPDISNRIFATATITIGYIPLLQLSQPPWSFFQGALRFSLIASVTACNLRSGFVICPNYRFFIYPNYRSWPRLLMGAALPWLPGLPLNSDQHCWWSSNQRLLKLGYIWQLHNVHMHIMATKLGISTSCLYSRIVRPTKLMGGQNMIID